MNDLTKRLKGLPRHLSRTTVYRLLIGAVIIGVILYAGEELRPHLPKMEAWIQAQGAWAPTIYILLLVLLTVFCFPQDVLWIAGGLLFHLGLGFVYVIIGIMVGQSINYWLGRTLLRDRVERYVSKRRTMHAVSLAIREEGIKLLFMLRLAPLPASPCSYLMGATSMPYRHFLLGTLGLLPVAFASMYFGFAAAHATRTDSPRHVFNANDALIFGGLLLAIGIMAYISHRAKKMLKKVEAEQTLLDISVR